MKLKTLKDLERDGYPIRREVLAEVKQEAIKRVKNCKENRASFVLECNEVVKEFKCGGCKRDIWFNNITEEDLK